MRCLKPLRKCFDADGMDQIERAEHTELIHRYILQLLYGKKLDAIAECGIFSFVDHPFIDLSDCTGKEGIMAYARGFRCFSQAFKHFEQAINGATVTMDGLVTGVT